MTEQTDTNRDAAELQQALERLFSLQTFGVKLGLDQTLRLLDRFGNPHLGLRCVHVAGTNGKGSVCAMIASVLQASGLRVGLFSSPHLSRFNERMRIDGQPISDDDLIGYTRRMMPVIEELECTFFEGTTAMAFAYFADQDVDIAVIETGMGGRLDSTNVVTPLVSVITSIGYDHTKHLGTTLEKIAGEKAGIIKPNVPAVIGPVALRLRNLFREKVRQIGAGELAFVEDVARIVTHAMSFDGMDLSVLIRSEELPHVHVDLCGRHQLDNVRTALVALESLKRHVAISEDDIRSGLGSIAKSTGFRGRLETVRTQPHVVADVAHNADGVRVLTETVASLLGRKPVLRLVYGSVKDKNVFESLKLFQPFVRKLYAVCAKSHRSLEKEEIVYHGNQLEIPTESFEDVADGVRVAMNEAGEEELVLICGSFFVVGEALHWLENTGDSLSSIHESLNDYRTDQDETTERRLTVKEWSPGERPRERLIHHGAQSLTDAELLAILLRTGTKEQDVLELSRYLVNTFGSLTKLAARDLTELQTVKGIGQTKAVTLAAAFQLAARLQAEPFDSLPQIGGPEDVAQIFIPKMRNARKEEFHIILLNTAHRIIRTVRISEGNLNSSIVHPREVFRHAVIESAAAVIGLHNHPSGNPVPSQHDITITKQLVESGKLLGIPFHDHIIIAGESYVSLAEKGMM